MQPIIIPFTPNNLGRVVFVADVMTGNRLSFRRVYFKLDSGSDFTTVSCDDLEMLGYESEYLESCPYHDEKAQRKSKTPQFYFSGNLPCNMRCVIYRGLKDF